MSGVSNAGDSTRLNYIEYDAAHEEISQGHFIKEILLRSHDPKDQGYQTTKYECTFESYFNVVQTLSFVPPVILEQKF